MAVTESSGGLKIGVGRTVQGAAGTIDLLGGHAPGPGGIGGAILVSSGFGDEYGGGVAVQAGSSEEGNGGSVSLWTGGSRVAEKSGSITLATANSPGVGESG